jgi:hypothetical protein
MERDYEAELEHDLLMMITEKILVHAIEDGKIDLGMMGGKMCPNPFNAFMNINPRMLVNCIMEGEETWGECWDRYIKMHRPELRRPDQEKE